MQYYQNTASYENIVMEIFGGYEMLEDIIIHQKINEHTTIKLTAMVSEQSALKYETELLSKQAIKVIQKTEEQDIVHFGGMIQCLTVERKNGIYYIHIDGVSLTKFIDIKKQNVSYQNENSTYQDIVDKAIQEYNFPGMTYIWTEQSRSKKVGRFLLQFQETDWEFIKRVASIENLGLIPNMTGKQTQFFIGLPKGREEKIVPYCKHKVHRLLEKAEKEVVNNKVNTIWQGDYIQYELYDITEHYELGDVVRFQDMQYIVIEKTSTLLKKDGILRNNYVIQQKKGIAFPRLYNNALRGNSLTGTVIDVKRNFTKLHLHIDEEQQDIATAFWFTQPQCFTAGSDSGFCIMPERGDTMRLHFPTKDETEHYIICSDNGDFSKLLSSLNASKGGKQPEKTAKVSGSNAPYEKYLTTPGQKGMLLNDGMVKYHTTGDISSIQMEDGKGISISSDGNIELLANNINLKAGAKLNITAGKKIEISCIGSSMIIDGEGDRIDKKAPDVFFDSPENVIVDVPVDAIEQLFASHAAERKAAVLEFTPDEIRITAENKFDDGIYQLLYDVWKETSGEYDPKDDKPIVDPRGNVHTQNETKFKYWAMEQYGMTAEEYRGYTFKGTGKTILETVGAYFKVTAPVYTKNGITYLAKKGVTPKNVLKAAFGMTDDITVGTTTKVIKNSKSIQNIADLNDVQLEALKTYTGANYININKSLRGIGKLTPDNELTVNAMKSALNNARLPENMTLYRGTSKETLGKLQKLPINKLVGKTFVEKGFMSTSIYRGVADSFLGNMEITIKAAKGAKALNISSISQLPHESEILFNVGQEMLITFAEEKKGILYIIVELK